MAPRKKECCSFCGNHGTSAAPLIPSPLGDAYICTNCIQMAAEALGIISDDTAARARRSNAANIERQQFASAGNEHFDHIPLPSEIKNFLDQYVIGQDTAKKYLSVAVYNHYKRLSQPSDENDTEIEKSNIIMVGPTGTGKTLLARTIARMLDVPFTIVDATVLTQAGYVGEDIESLLTRLLQAADYDVAKAEKGIVFIDEIDKIARKGDNPSITRDVGGEGVQQGLLKLLEGSVVNVPPHGGRKHPEQAMIAVDIERDSYMAHVAPQDLKTFGLIPEIIGRLPILSHLLPLGREGLRRILTEPKNAIVRQYVKLFGMDNISLPFTDDALDYIVDKAIEFKLGARGLRSIVETIMMDAMYTLPGSGTDKLTVDAAYCAAELDKAHFDANAV